MDYAGKVFIAGRNGMVGAAIERKFREEGHSNIVGLGSKELDLRRQRDVERFFMRERPDYVILAAAKVGGIMANIQAPAEFLFDNLAIQCNVIDVAYRFGVRKLMFLASSCIYPRDASQPMREEYLLDGKPEPTNEGYALAKIAGLKMCEYYNRQYGTDFISVMPCNLYGPGDSFDPVRSHVVAALVRKAYEAKMAGADEVTVWGTGTARRELMYVGDMADACYYLFRTYTGDGFINIGTGMDCSIRELAEIVMEKAGYQGRLVFDTSKPDGMPQKLLDVTRLGELGWQPSVSLEEGIELTCQYYLKKIKKE